MRQDVIETLKKHNDILAEIELKEAQIIAWKMAIDNPHLRDPECVDTPEIELGMPRAKNWKPGSPVERMIVTEQLTDEMIQEWIENYERYLWPIKRRLEKLDIAIKHLSDKEKTIIDLKYMQGMKWEEIETEFNKRHKKGDEIQVRQLQRNHSGIIDKIVDYMYP